MQQIDDILKAAILGTDKFVPQTFPHLGAFAARLAAQNTEKEDIFLKLAYATFLYEEAGSAGFETKTVLPICPRETKKETSDNISNRVEMAIENKEDVILAYLVYQINKKNEVVKRSVIPTLLNKAIQNKNLANELLKICGETGKWLCQLNESWNKLTEEAEIEDVWNEGSLAARKNYFSALRMNNPDAARELLSKTINTESANARTEFLEIFANKLSLDDESFLVQFINDKSAGVRLKVRELLKNLEGSNLNILFFNFVMQCLEIKEERYMILYKKKVLVINENIKPSPEIFDAGVEEICSHADIRDSIFWLSQILMYINPLRLAEALNCKELELINCFLEHQDKKYLIHSLCVSSIYFKNKIWARELLKLEEVSLVNLLGVLEKKEQEPFIAKYIEQHLMLMIDFLCSKDYETISDSDAIYILEQLKKTPYGVEKTRYKFLALHLSNRMIDLIHKLSQTLVDDYSARHFKAMCEEMIEIIELKLEFIEF